jgi:NAD(P)-dependent dehydrogenase (short-subunit alcohol dehydrogenase family)
MGLGQALREDLARRGAIVIVADINGEACGSPESDRLRSGGVAPLVSMVKATDAGK